MVLFKKKLKCGLCSGGMKSKKEKSGRRIYVCSRNDNLGECKRIPIAEEFIIELLENRLEKEITKEIIHNEVDYVEVFGKMEMTIHMKKDENIILSKNYLNL